jgi:hypothetical protein
MTRLLMGTAMLMGAMAIGTAQERTVMVGGQSMFPTRNIVENAIDGWFHGIVCHLISPDTKGF